MMMISSRSSALASRARRNRLFAFVALVVLVAAAVLWRAPLGSFFWNTLSPLMQLRFSSTPSEAQLASTTAALADRDVLYQENLDLKARLGRSDTVPQRILAAILMRPPGTPYDTLVIDAGESEGVAVGDYVSAGGTALVGVVSEAYSHTARVKLFSAPGEQHEALLQHAGAQTVPLSLEGQGGGSMSAQVPSGTVVSAGDSALVAGIAGGLVARVSHVDQAESSFVTVYFQLPVDLFGLRFVEVWKQTSHDTK